MIENKRFAFLRTQNHNLKTMLLFGTGLVLLFVITYLFVYRQRSDREIRTNTYRLTVEEQSLLQEGDVILRHGFGLISDAIVKYAHDPCPVSHCGIIVKDSSGQWAVIHTVSNVLADIDGMQQDGLEKFVVESHPGSVIVLRFRYTDEVSTSKIAQQATYYLTRQIPFDHRFDAADTSAFFCTELIQNVFNKAINIDLYAQPSGKNVNCLTFAPLLDTNKFVVIVNHGQVDK
ncbi:MAG: hypothetical protein LBQ64_01685 [Bacteroidales bacterium]|jgi:hypothetical protein|nr:hypothetical protein [Bacteroidales bacterium]